MSWKLRSILGLAALALAAQAAAQATFYEGEGFRGRAFTANKAVTNLASSGFNDRASSVVVDSGTWEICENSAFGGRCMVLRKGSYDTLSRMGMNDRISSVRPVSSRGRHANVAPEPLAAPTYAYRRRSNERVFDAPVTSVRAVMGQAEQRCWVERQQVPEPSRSELNVGGAVLGAILGGVLGHQVGSGSGNDIATAGGAVAGGVIGANVGRTGGGSERDVRRCENAASGAPQYWDVTYSFRSVEHRLQMSAPPGPTIAVNQNGEPRQ